MRHRTQRRRVSSGAWTTRPRLSRMVCAVCAASATRSGLLPISSKQALDFIENHGRDLTLARLGGATLTVRRDEDDLVVRSVEPDIGAGHIVVDDEIGVLAVEHPSFAFEPLLPMLGAEGDQELAGPLALAERAGNVGGRLQLERPRIPRLRALGR